MTSLKKSLILVFTVFALLVLGYIVIAPFEPLVRYELFGNDNNDTEISDETGPKIVDVVNAATIKNTSSLASLKLPTKDNRLVIKRIGVNAHISNNPNPKKGLNEGVWMDPGGSTPDQGGNTIVAGHRWKYRPPNNTTFYLLDKVKIGDDLVVDWKQKKYVYKVKEIKIVNPDDTSVLQQTDNPTLTVYTCTPLFSTKHRLVLVAGLEETTSTAKVQ